MSKFFGRTASAAQIATEHESADEARSTESPILVPRSEAVEPWTRKELVRVLRLRVPGIIELLTNDGGERFAAEEYRMIRTGIVRTLQRPFCLAISSPCIGDGKTVTAANIATALAMSAEGDTLLVDTDLHGASLHSRLQIPRAPGLAEVLDGKATLEDAIVRFEQLKALHVLPAGDEVSNATDLFDSARWRGLVQTMRHHFNHVVMDCSPVGFFADFELISAVSDGVLLVVRPDHTGRPQCMAALSKIRTKLTGVVINCAEDWFLWKKSTHQYYAHYGSGKNAGKGSGKKTGNDPDV